MPTYEYACDICNHHFGAVQSMSDEPLSDCPQCAGRVRRLFTPSSVIFKGSGFYCNDVKSRESKQESPCATCPASQN